MWAGGDHLPDFVKTSFRLSLLFPENKQKKDLELDVSQGVRTTLSCRVSAHEGLCKEERISSLAFGDRVLVVSTGLTY